MDTSSACLQAKKLEPLVWAEIERVLTSPKMAEGLIATMRATHMERTQSSEIKKRSEKVRQLDQQMEVLAERLAQLPKAISPFAIFKQMERLEEFKKIEEDRISGLRALEVISDPPATLESYKELLIGLRFIAENPQSHITKDRIVRALIERVEVTPDGFKLHFYLGKEYINQELARWGRSPLGGSDQKFKLNVGSNELTFGAHYWTRTSMPRGATPSRWCVYQFHQVGTSLSRIKFVLCCLIAVKGPLVKIEMILKAIEVRFKMIDLLLNN